MIVRREDGVLKICICTLMNRKCTHRLSVCVLNGGRRDAPPQLTEPTRH